MFESLDQDMVSRSLVNISRVALVQMFKLGSGRHPRFPKLLKVDFVPAARGGYGTGGCGEGGADGAAQSGERGRHRKRE